MSPDIDRFVVTLAHRVQKRFPGVVVDAIAALQVRIVVLVVVRGLLKLSYERLV